MTLSFSPVKNNNASQEVSGVLSPYHSSSAADTRDEHPNLPYDEFTDIDDDIFSMLSSAYCDVIRCMPLAGLLESQARPLAPAITTPVIPKPKRQKLMEEDQLKSPITPWVDGKHKQV